MTSKRQRFGSGYQPPASEWHNRRADCPVCIAEIATDRLVAMASSDVGDVAALDSRLRVALSAFETIRFRAKRVCERHALLAEAAS